MDCTRSILTVPNNWCTYLISDVAVSSYTSACDQFTPQLLWKTISRVYFSKLPSSCPVFVQERSLLWPFHFIQICCKDADAVTNYSLPSHILLGFQEYMFAQIVKRRKSVKEIVVLYCLDGISMSKQHGFINL